MQHNTERQKTLVLKPILGNDLRNRQPGHGKISFLTIRFRQIRRNLSPHSVWSVFFVLPGPAPNHILGIFSNRNATKPSQGPHRAGEAFGNMACRRGLGQKSDWNMTSSWPQNRLQEAGFPTMGYGVSLGSHMVANLLGFTHLTQTTNFSWYCMQICISLFGVASDTIFLKCYDIVCPTHGVFG